MAIPRGYQPFHGGERTPVPGSELIGPAEPNEQLSVVILLRQKPGSPELPDLEYWQNTHPASRRFLSVDAFFETYGASQADVDAVVEFAAAHKLEIVEAHSGRRRIEIRGTAGGFDAAFGITLNRYRAPRRHLGHRTPVAKERSAEADIYRGFEGPVHLPARLLEVVRAVIGLDNRRGGGPAVGTGDPPDAQYLSPAKIAQLYNFPRNAAAGQTVGLFEAADDGAAYLHGDINQFIANLPAGFNTPPVLSDIGLLGQTNNPALVSPFNGGALEATLDVAVAATVAQGANINVYFTTDTELGWETFFNRALFPHPGDNPPSVLSASWVFKFSDDQGTIGLPSVFGTIAFWLSNIYLRAAAARGITVFMAIGDWGSADQVPPPPPPVGLGPCHVAYPNADPWVTACGGTIIGNIVSPNPGTWLTCYGQTMPAGMSPGATFEEWTWSEAGTASQFQNLPYESTGGGVSDNFAIPPYQISAGVLPISLNDGNRRRGLPDVAGMVAMDGFFINNQVSWPGGGGPNGNGLFGTSAVSPLYAGLVAVINAFLGHNSGFLNPTFYRYGAQICNDITIGNNDSGEFLPDAPSYKAAIGWDACTGWGSINGMRLMAAVAPAPIIVTSIAGCGFFGDACVCSFIDEILTINNAGFSELLIRDITVAPATDFAIPNVQSYPIAVGPGSSIDLVIRFQPGSLTPAVKNATITIVSNDLFSPATISVSGNAVAPKIVLGIADSGNFGTVCVGSFADEPLLVNNGGACTLLIDDLTASSGAFLVPQILSYPIAVAAGASVSIPIRFQPAAVGPAGPATITVTSNDPNHPTRSVSVFGFAPSGKLAVTGSTFFGCVPACCREERTIAICNVGDCKLQVASVAFRRKSRHWKLINNPFPATLHPGSCLSVVIRYKATEKFAHACELVITSDDPTTPVKTLEVVATTGWNERGCSKCCDDCRRGCCEKRHCEPRHCENCHGPRHDDCDGDDGGDDDCND